MNEKADPAAPRANGPLRVIALSTFPIESASTRFRIAQFIGQLASEDIQVTLLPFLTYADFKGLYDRKRAPLTTLRLAIALFRRLIQIPRILTADVLLVQREAMLFGPPLIEWLAARMARVPLVLDLDDATWTPQTSPVYGRLATMLKFPGKTDWLIRQARMVICGNETIAAYVAAKAARAVVLQTIVDASVFTPAPGAGSRDSDLPTVGWVGTHSSWSYLSPILPSLQTVAKSVPFRLCIVGSGQKSLSLPGIEVELRAWRIDREVHDFQSLDVGLYPLDDDAWAESKSGLKAIEYLACGVPYVASPVGIAGRIGQAGVTHLLARSPDEWCTALERLLRDHEARREMGAAGRRFMLEHYTINDFAARIGDVLRDAASTARSRHRT